MSSLSLLLVLAGVTKGQRNDDNFKTLRGLMKYINILRVNMKLALIQLLLFPHVHHPLMLERVCVSLLLEMENLRTVGND